MCEPCGDGSDGFASPKHPLFKVSCGQTEEHSLFMGVEAWQLFSSETSPEGVLGVPLKGTVDVLWEGECSHTCACIGSIGPSCDKWLYVQLCEILNFCLSEQNKLGQKIGKIVSWNYISHVQKCFRVLF